MKTLKRLAVAIVLVAGLGMAFTSCSESAYYDDPVNLPIHDVENPIERPGISPYQKNAPTGKVKVN